MKLKRLVYFLRSEKDHKLNHKLGKRQKNFERQTMKELQRPKQSIINYKDKNEG